MKTKNKEWQKTVISWDSGLVRETNISPDKPQIWKSRVCYGISKLQAVSVPGNVAIITFEITTRSEYANAESVGLVLDRLNQLLKKWVFTRSYKLVTSHDIGFKICLSYKGTFCDSVVDFITDFHKAFEMHMDQVEYFGITTTRLYSYRYGYVDFTDHFKRKRGFTARSYEPEKMPTTAPLR